MKEQNKNEQITCPYCKEEMVKTKSPLCRACSLKLFYCPRCRKPFPRTSRQCPHCGADIRAGTR
ncbi:MAG: hypothetical protein IBX68_00150 [Dehalococcoidia bacterium]|nr:hypothetical protein [Dehalococcoidia bacterium]